MDSSQNENVMIIDGENEISWNEWNMKDEIMNGNLQTKQNTTKEITNHNENNEMERNLQTLHTQMKKWRRHSRNVICWAFYYVNDDKEVDLLNLQVMRCVLCYNNPMYALYPNTK